MVCVFKNATRQILKIINFIKKKIIDFGRKYISSVNKTRISRYSPMVPYPIYSIVLNGLSVLICMMCLFGTTIEEIVKIIDFSHEEWSKLLEKILYFTRIHALPTFLRYALYRMYAISLNGLSATYLHYMMCLFGNTLRETP